MSASVYVVGRTELGDTRLFGVFACSERAEAAAAMLGAGGFVQGLYVDDCALIQEESREALEEAAVVVRAARMLGIESESA